MRIKSILKENFKEEKLEELNQLLQNKYQNDLKQEVYRGYEEEIKYYREKEIRKDRDTVDVPFYLQMLVDVMSEDYPHVPKRAESKFATTSWMHATDFGTSYRCFFHKNATVVSSKEDTYENPLYNVERFFRYIIHEYANVDHEEIPRNVRHFYKAARLLKKLKDKRTKQSMKRFYDFFKKHSDKIKKQGEMEGGDELYDAMKLIDVEYFQKFTEEINQGDREIMFNGESYLLVNSKFFENNFVWDDLLRKWVLEKN